MTDAAKSVALAALKKVREGLDGEERPEPVNAEHYDVIVDAKCPVTREGDTFSDSPTHSFRMYRSLQTAIKDMDLAGKSIYVAPDGGDA